MPARTAFFFARLCDLSAARLRPLALGAAAAVSLLAVGCGGNQGTNSAPIIDSVDAPLTVTAQNGSYVIPVSLLFHDSDGEAVTRLHYRLPPDIEGMVDVSAPNPERESAEVTIVIPTSAVESPTATSDATVANDGEHRATDDGRRPEGPSTRGHARMMQISVVDGRGAESIAQSSSVTLD